MKNLFLFTTAVCMCAALPAQAQNWDYTYPQNGYYPVGQTYTPPPPSIL